MADKVKSYSAGVLFIIFIGVLVWFANSLNGGQSYDVRPEISVPAYKSDAARAIDAYEKVMDRYMDISENNFRSMAADNAKVFEKLLELQTDIMQIDQRLGRIEKAMGLEPLPAVCPAQSKTSAEAIPVKQAPAEENF